MEREPRPRQSQIVRYAVALLIGAAIVLGMVWVRGAFTEVNPQRVYRVLCDGFFLAAVLLTGIGLMTLVAGEGTFDIAGFAATLLLRVFWRKTIDKKENRSFYEYKKAKREHRKGGPMWFLVFTGLFYLAAAFVFNALFNTLA
ncbi:MAG: DUF3899 domain-containing protein [Clostridiaceae bacterium]|nr:DUF3899 domain-containing protein [Eubacteriales bacterium]